MIIETLFKLLLTILKIYSAKNKLVCLGIFYSIHDVFSLFQEPLKYNAFLNIIILKFTSLIYMCIYILIIAVLTDPI